MTDQDLVERLNQRRPPCVLTLGGEVMRISKAEGRAVMRFVARPDFCHSGTIVQGGFITGMIDAAMSHALMAATDLQFAVPTLELKVSFFEPGNPGPMVAEGVVARLGRSTAFLEGTLQSERNSVIAKATATARLVPIAPRG